MNEMEQLFGQFSAEEEKKDNWRLIPQLILVLLTLAIIAILAFLSVGQVAAPLVMSTLENKNKKNLEPPAAEICLPPKIINRDTSVTTTVATIPSPLEPKKTIREAIYQALLKEFHNDLAEWSASLDPQSLTISFRDSRYFFSVGYSNITPYYQTILSNFFPRYVNLLKQFANLIEALSIEGHTSSEWTSSASLDEAYFNNMALSQLRTRSVLEYCLQLPSVSVHKEWLRQILSANGLSSGRVITNNGLENPESSRRVEFRVFLK